MNEERKRTKCWLSVCCVGWEQSNYHWVLSVPRNSRTPNIAVRLSWLSFSRFCWESEPSLPVSDTTYAQEFVTVLLCCVFFFILLLPSQSIFLSYLFSFSFSVAPSIYGACAWWITFFFFFHFLVFCFYFVLFGKLFSASSDPNSVCVARGASLVIGQW